jgi:hypothetical protein
VFVLSICLQSAYCYATLNVVVKVSEGLVLGADSRSTYQNVKGAYRSASDQAQKIFQLSKNVGCLVRGEAFFKEWTVGGFISSYRSECDLTDDISQHFDTIMTSFDRFVRANLSVSDSIGTDVIVAGYDLDGRARIAEYSLRNRRSFPHLVNERVGLVFKGQRELIDRLLNGVYDYEEVSAVQKKILGRALREIIGDTLTCHRDSVLLNSVYNRYSKEFLDMLPYQPSGTKAIVLTDKMYLQDAIEYARFLIRTTIDFQRFTDGTNSDKGSIPGVGGDIDIAVVTPTGFEWISRKSLR